MKTSSWLSGIVLILLLSRCVPMESVIDSDVQHSTTWFAGTRYFLQKPVSVRPGVTLTLQPGVVVEASTGASLNIPVGAKLIAEGTTMEPIVFTSERETYWDGLKLESDFGRIKFLRLEFAGLLMENCAQTASVENLHIHRAKADGLTLRGGNVDLRRVVVTTAQHVGVAMEHGYHGRIQSLVVQQTSDSGGVALSDLQSLHPSPTLSNVTLVGAIKTSGSADIRNLVHLLRSQDVAQSEVSHNKVRSSLFWPQTLAQAVWPKGAFEWRNGNCVANPGLRNPFDAQMPDFTADFDSPVFTSAVPDDPFFHDSENFVGAVGTENWLDGWTRFEMGSMGSLSLSAAIGNSRSTLKGL